MKEKVLKYSIYITGFFCLYVFIAVRVLPLYNSLLVEKLLPGYWDFTKYGELYYFNFIKHFREENLPPATVKHQYSQKQAEVNTAEIFTFGDSFFDISRKDQYPSMLSEKLNKKVHFGYFDYPLQYLKEKGYNDKEPKIMVMGIVERYIPIKFARPHDTTLVVKKDTSKLLATARKVRDFIFYKRSETMYDALLMRSYFTTDIYSEIATIKFDLFGYIPKYTPVYSLDDSVPWLFVDDEVDGNNTSYYYHHSMVEMENICNNIKDLSEKLKRLYNIHLVFMPIPAKFTLYHTIVSNERYNNFIPRLQEGLTKRNVSYIDVYSEFRSSDQVLYYGTDAHWNVKGLESAVDLTIKYLKESNLINL